jgi:hypothetical protein
MRAMLPAKRGRGIRVAGASGWVEFCDRQRSHPRISRCQPERLYDLVERRSGVAAVGILRQRGINEVEDVNIDVSGERTRREMVKCSPSRTSWIGDERLAGGHVQAEPVRLLALPLGSHAGLHPEPCDLVGLEQRPGSKRVGEGVHATGQGQRVRQPHPVQSPVRGAFRGVDVVMAVDVQQSGSAGAQAPQGGHHPEHDRAVAAEHQSKVAARQQRLEPARCVSAGERGSR